MELLPRPLYATWKRFSRRKGYQRLDEASSAGRRNVKVIRIRKSPSSRRLWKIKAVPKLRLRISSPLKLLKRLKNAYIEKMVGLVGKVGALNHDTNTFGEKRIPRARQGKLVYAGEEFEIRLIYEISKALIASRELNPAM